MSGLLEARTAIVTGAAQGIGYEIAAALGDAGANVLVADIDEGNAAAAADKLTSQSGNRFRGVGADVTDEQDVARIVDTAIEEFGALDIYVNNAGITRDNLAMQLTDEDWQSVVDVDLTAAFRLIPHEIKSIDDLNGKVIAAKTGTATIDWIKAHLKPKEVRQFPNIDQAYLALEAGRVDAAMVLGQHLEGDRAAERVTDDGGGAAQFGVGELGVEVARRGIEVTEARNVGERAVGGHQPRDVLAPHRRCGEHGIERAETLVAAEHLHAAFEVLRLDGNERGEQVCEALRQLRSILTAAPARPHVRELLQNLDRRGRGHPAVADRRDESAARRLQRVVRADRVDEDAGVEQDHRPARSVSSSARSSAGSGTSIGGASRIAAAAAARRV